MPLALEYQEPSRFHVVVDGTITTHDVSGIVARLMSHPKLRPGTDVLVDARKAANALSTLELRGIARDMRPLLELGLGSVGVVADNPFIYGVTRMFCVFASAIGANVGAFRDFEAARLWLAEKRQPVS